MTSWAGTLAAISADAAALVPTRLGDDELLDAHRSAVEARRRLDAVIASLAAEVARRSAPDAGYAGLAQRRGMRTPEALVQQVTGGSVRDARTLIRVGSLLRDAPAWLAPVGDAVADGTLSLDAADAIRTGLGIPTDEVTTESLTDAARKLIGQAGSLTVERLAIEARAARDCLDEAGVADRERRRRERRYLHVIPQQDGMTRLSGLLDPESAAVLVGAIDAVTSPRRGGPRFVDPEAVNRSESLLRDERTTEQIAVDALVDMVRIAVAVDDGTVFGVQKPAVHVLVTAAELQRHHGIARLEGQPDPVSVATAERHVCSGGLVAAVFDATWQPVDVGRDQRLFTSRQRVAIAARDGGCLFPGCDRPPSWCEAHHITEWSRGGRTDVADGVLLCRHHHLLVHNNGWRITRDRGGYRLIPPRAHDPARRPIPLPSKSAALRRLQEIAV